MNKTTAVIMLGLAVIGGFLIFNKPRSDTQQKLESKTDDQSAVAITVTPIDLSSESKEWKFNIVMETHSVELDQDMIKSAVLIDDKGKEYKPLKWDGPAGGHHREGVLMFNSITPTPKSIELKVSGIGAVSRSFSWPVLF